MIEHLEPSNGDALIYTLDFLALSLKKPPQSLPTDQINSEKWVRNQAMQNFGPILHAVYLKSKTSHMQEKISCKITEVCNGFYDLNLLNIERQDQDSFSIEDDIVKIKEMWAYHLPCVLHINRAEYWNRLKLVY